MSQSDVIGQVRKGMEVHSSDGEKLGKVSEVYIGSETPGSVGQVEEESCIEVHRGLLGRQATYIPCKVIDVVTGGAVLLSVDAGTVQSNPSWHRKPSWIGT